MKARAITLIFAGFFISCKSPIIQEENLSEKCPDYVYSVPFNNNIKSVEIEDANFEKYLIQKKYDTDKTVNGRISLVDALKIEEIYIFSMSVAAPSDDIIRSVKGIEYFKNLKSFISMSHLIEAIDFSHNENLEVIRIKDDNAYLSGETDKYKALKYINLGVNHKLKTLGLSNVLVKEVDISKTPNIEKLRIWSNHLENVYVKSEKQINPTALEIYKSKGELKIITPEDWFVTNHKGNFEYKICK